MGETPKQVFESIVRFLKERYPNHPGIRLGWEVGVDHYPNSTTGMMEMMPNDGYTITIQINGGARERHY